MKKWLRRGRSLGQAWCSETGLCMLVLCIVAVSLILVLWIGFYDVPSADDFTYGAGMHQVWKNTGSLLEVLRAAAQSVRGWYLVWQGTFSAIFLMCLQPAVFDAGLYRMVPILMVGGTCCGRGVFLLGAVPEVLWCHPATVSDRCCGLAPSVGTIGTQCGGGILLV